MTDQKSRINCKCVWNFSAQAQKPRLGDKFLHRCKNISSPARAMLLGLLWCQVKIRERGSNQGDSMVEIIWWWWSGCGIVQEQNQDNIAWKFEFQSTVKCRKYGKQGRAKIDRQERWMNKQAGALLGEYTLQASHYITINFSGTSALLPCKKTPSNKLVTKPCKQVDHISPQILKYGVKQISFYSINWNISVMTIELVDLQYSHD